MCNKSFLFQEEDIIVCEFDPIKKVLSFKKHKSTNRFTMQVEFPEGEKVYACVNLCNKDDKVEIV